MKKMRISVPRIKIENFCKQWKIAELSFFGSILRDDFHQNSDVDILVEFLPNSSWGLLGLAKIEDKLSQIFERRIDLVSKKAVKNSRNWIRRQNILESAEVFFTA